MKYARLLCPAGHKECFPCLIKLPLCVKYLGKFKVFESLLPDKETSIYFNHDIE